MRIFGVVVSFLIAAASQAVPLHGWEDADSQLPDGVVARLGSPVRSNHHQAVAIAFSRDDELLACAGMRTQSYRALGARFPIEVYDTERMNRLVVLEGNEAPVEALQISRSKDWVASLGGGIVHLWSLPSGEQRWSVRHLNVQQAAFSADGKHLFVADRSEQVWVLDLESGEVVREHSLAKAEQPVNPWAVPAPGVAAPGGNRKVQIAFSEKDGTMIIKEEGKEPVKLDLRAMGRKLNYWRRIRFLPDGKNLVWLTDEGAFEVRDVMTGETVRGGPIDVGIMIRKKFNGDDEEPSPVGLLWPSSNSQSVQVRVSDTVSQMSFDGKTVRKTLFSWPPPASWLEGEYSLSPDVEPDAPRGEGEGKMAWFADSLAISPDGKRAALMGRRDANRSEVRVLDLERETTLRTFALESRYRERRLYGGRIHATPQIRSLKPVTGSFSHDGKRLAVEMMGEIRLLELATGEEVLGENRVAVGEGPILQEHEDKIAAIVFSPDGKLVATASYDSTIRLWNARTGEELLRREHEWLSAPQYAVAFSPDSTQLAADLRNKVEVLRCSDGETICMLEGKAVSRVTAEATGGRLLARWWPFGDLDRFPKIGHLVGDSLGSAGQDGPPGTSS
jgi:WD40 repeat protein